MLYVNLLESGQISPFLGKLFNRNQTGLQESRTGLETNLLKRFSEQTLHFVANCSTTGLLPMVLALGHVKLSLNITTACRLGNHKHALRYQGNNLMDYPHNRLSDRIS